MNREFTLLGAAGLGAGLMYFLDPVLGRRRRGALRDKLTSAIARADDVVSKTGRDLAQRAAGFAAEASARFRGKDNVPDVVLAERIRSALGRFSSHASSLSVTAREGHVTLKGPILASEVNDVLEAVRAVRGVCEVENQLDVHEHAQNIPGLQGAGRRPGKRPDFLQPNWAPATRFLIGAAGTAMMAYAVRRRTPLAALFGAAGLNLFLRGLTNIEMGPLLGLGQSRRGINFVKTINIDAPLEQVFRFWQNFENFPHFMTHVREVRDLGEGRSHWTIEGPAGVLIHWEAVITRLIENRLISWKSAPRSPVAHAGTVHFQANDNGGTRVHILMSYVPPAGIFGHAVAGLFGANPKQEMDDDLVRMKTFMETGIPPHDAAVREPHMHSGRHGAGTSVSAREVAEATGAEFPDPAMKLWSY